MLLNRSGRNKPKEDVRKPVTKIIWEGEHKMGFYSTINFKDYLKRSSGAKGIAPRPVRESEKFSDFYHYYNTSMVFHYDLSNTFSSIYLTGSLEAISQAEKSIKKAEKIFKRTGKFSDSGKKDTRISTKIFTQKKDSLQQTLQN